MTGPRLLNDWLATRDMSAYAFALKIGVAHDTVLSLTRGEARRISVELAAKVEDATEGVVPMRSWVKP